MVINNKNIEMLITQIEEFINGKVVEKKVDNLDEMSWCNQIDTIFENTMVSYDNTDIRLENFLKTTADVFEVDRAFEINLCRKGNIYVVIRIPYIDTQVIDKVKLTTGISIEILQ